MLPAPGGGGGGNKKWCIAKTGLQKTVMKKDYEDLCKEVDCKPTEGSGLCYTESNFAKVSFAMNAKYQKNGQKDADCNYEGRAEITTKDPSTLTRVSIIFVFGSSTYKVLLYKIKLTRSIFFLQAGVSALSPLILKS